MTTTNPKKSKVAVSYPGAMLNIMVKVSCKTDYSEVIIGISNLFICSYTAVDKIINENVKII